MSLERIRFSSAVRARIGAICAEIPDFLTHKYVEDLQFESHPDLIDVNGLEEPYQEESTSLGTVFILILLHPVIVYWLIISRNNIVAFFS